MNIARPMIDIEDLSRLGEGTEQGIIATGSLFLPVIPHRCPLGGATQGRQHRPVKIQGKAVDGIKITQILKADPKTAALPVILVTAHAMQGDRENFLKQSGADGYISKPIVDHQEFVDQIQELAARKGIAQ